MEVGVARAAFLIFKTRDAEARSPFIRLVHLELLALVPCGGVHCATDHSFPNSRQRVCTVEKQLLETLIEVEFKRGDELLPFCHSVLFRCRQPKAICLRSATCKHAGEALDVKKIVEDLSDVWCARECDPPG